MIKLNASEHPIKSVTVFKSSKAEVVRTFSLELKKGQNKIEIKGLSTLIDKQTVRVSGLGEARLFDVTCTCESSKAASYMPDSPAEVKRLLLVKKAELESEKAVVQKESELLLKYGETLTGEHVTTTQMALFLESYVDRGRKIAQAVTKLNEEVVSITRRIELLDEKTITKHGTAFGKVDITIVADSDLPVDLKLTYIVGEVQWTPTYELHATTENGKPCSSVSLHYRARVSQCTGEDWNNTFLTLSTIASDTIAKRIPQLRPVKMRVKSPFQTRGGMYFNKAANTNNPPQHLFGPSNNQQTSTFAPQPASLFSTNRGGLFGQPQQQQQQQQQAPPAFWFGTSDFSSAPTLFGSTAPQPGPLPAAAPPQPTAPPPADEDHPTDWELYEPDAGSVAEPTTVVSETPVAISFSVHGESTIPSDGVEHQVSVAILPFEAKISYICIPRIDPRVYLQCVVKNTSEYRLLPGPVTVIFDDSYVSKTSINDINTGDNFECTLGDDPSTKVTYARTSKTVKSSGGAFAEVTNTTTYKTSISIQNKHQFAITDLVVRDVVPTLDEKDKRASIVLRTPKGLADAKEGETVDLKDGLRVQWEPLVDGKGGEKEGRFVWKWKIGSGAKVNLEAEWEVKVPGDEAWAETY